MGIKDKKNHEEAENDAAFTSVKLQNFGNERTKREAETIKIQKKANE